jgi:hypothetical protein
MKHEDLNEFDKYFGEALGEVMKINDKDMSIEHFKNLLLFIMCVKADLLNIN